MRRTALVLAAAGGLAVGMQAATATAAPVEDFYRGKVVSIIVSAGGGTYTLVARTVAKYMPEYLPGHPTMIVRNMPGAGHLLATNYMYSKAPKDGSVIASVGNSIALDQALGTKGVRFDSRKFNWLGSTGISNLMSVVWHTAGVRTIADVKKKEVIAGGTGAGSGTVVYPTILNNLIGTKFKIVIGYRNASAIDLAMERGEMQARNGYSYGSFIRQHPDWIRDGKAYFLYQVGLKPQKGPAGVPLMVDLAENSEQREILKLYSQSVELGRPYLAPPGVPADRVAALRKAFAAAIADPGYVKDSKKGHLDLFPTTWQEVAQSVAETIDAPADIIAKAKAAGEETGVGDCKTFSDATNCKAKKSKKKKEL